MRYATTEKKICITKAETKRTTSTLKHAKNLSIYQKQAARLVWAHLGGQMVDY